MKQTINGVLLLDKPSGISSNKALQRSRYYYQARKAGHTGTLDPLASGLLPICFGEATKFASFALHGSKEYIATICFGSVSTTYDSEGIITPVEAKTLIDEIQFKLSCKKFVGEIDQLPPIYSALKVAGKPLYSYARAGQEVDINARKVNIYSIDILNFDETNQQAMIKVACGAGTYIRSLAHDIGQDLACGGYLSALKRIKCNDFCLDNAISLAELETCSLELKHKHLFNIDVLVKHLPLLKVSPEEYAYLRHGHSTIGLNANNDSSSSATVEEVSLASPPLFRLYYNDNFIGIASIQNQSIIPKRLIGTDYLLAI